jgi:hypothetical protein
MKMLSNAQNHSPMLHQPKKSMFPAGGGLAHGGGISSGGARLADGAFSKRPEFVKNAVSSAGNEEKTAQVDEAKHEDGKEKPKGDASEKPKSVTLEGTLGGLHSHYASDNADGQGTIGEAKALSLKQSHEKLQKDEEARASKESKGKTDPEAPAQSYKFDQYVTDWGTEWKSSKSKKSPVFVPDDRTLPLKGWQSLRKANVSSKKTGSIPYSGYSILHKSGENEGRLYFLSTGAFKALKLKKKIVME